MTTSVNVARDFSRFPSGRYKVNGSTSGEAFREKFLQPHIGIGLPVVVELDGTIGYGSSFLEEAFGGLVRATPANVDVERLLTLRSENEILGDEILDYIREAVANRRKVKT